ncbi:MAG: hypothetical protein Kow0037_06200 [Calditrichia bacterium]
MDVKADKIRVEKANRKLSLLKNGQVLKTYRVALGRHPVGHKQREGDGRTPEGNYRIQWHNPNSAYHLSLKISYPNPQDRAAALRRGVSPGGFIMIHGLPEKWGWIGALHAFWDWTNGCIAVTNEEIEEIYRAVPDGTPIEILP